MSLSHEANLTSSARTRAAGRDSPVARFLVGFFLFGFIVDIGGAFGIKYLSTVLIVAYLALNARRIAIPKSVLLVEGSLFLAAPIIFLGISVVAFGQPLLAVILQLIYASTWLVMPLILLLDVGDVIEMFCDYMYYGAAMTLALFVGLLIAFFAGRPDLIARVNLFTAQYRLGFFGERAVGGLSLFVPNVYFGWTLLLVPAAVLLSGRNGWRLAIVLLAVLATLSTGAIAFAVIGLALLPLVSGSAGTFRMARGALWGLVVVAAVGAVLALSGYTAALQQVIDKFSSQSGSTSIKLGHIQSVLGLLDQHPVYLLTGMGIGTPFYSIGVDRVVVNVEVSHFNMVRQYGLIYALAFTGYVGLVVTALFRTDTMGRRLAIGVAMLFFAAGTNPVLQSPVFFLILVIARAYTLRWDGGLVATPRPRQDTSVAPAVSL